MKTGPLLLKILDSPISMDSCIVQCCLSWCLLIIDQFEAFTEGILEEETWWSVRQLAAAIFRAILQSDTIWECELLFTTNSLAVQTIHVGKRTRRCSMTHFIWSSLINERMKHDWRANFHENHIVF